MDNNAAIILLLADRQREIEALRARVGELETESAQLAEALNDARESSTSAPGSTMTRWKITKPPTPDSSCVKNSSAAPAE